MAKKQGRSVEGFRNLAIVQHLAMFRGVEVEVTSDREVSALREYLEGKMGQKKENDGWTAYEGMETAEEVLAWFKEEEGWSSDEDEEEEPLESSDEEDALGDLDEDGDEEQSMGGEMSFACKFSNLIHYSTHREAFNLLPVPI